MAKHPIQPIEKDEQGVLRFKQNSIVRYLLDKGPTDMNKIAVLRFSQEDREQFAQLIGYSLSGAGELGYFSDETYATAEGMATGKDERDARIEALEGMLAKVREGLKLIVPEVFRIHPDDLQS